MAPNRKLLLISNSYLHGYGYLQHAEREINTFLKGNNVKRVLFVPYALFDFDDYTKAAAETFAKWDLTIEGIHTFADPVQAVHNAEAIFIGGGNTFRLLTTLYEHNLVEAIQEVVLNKGVPFMSTSAGTNVAAKTIKTTNDMPICYPPSFNALNLVPFSINPHYLDPTPGDNHCGETRERRILEFQLMNSEPVLALREGTYLSVEGDKATVIGLVNGRLYLQGKEPEEIVPGTDVSFLMKV